MNFWKKYKAKKELKNKVEKARFVNFYGKKIDLSLGRIKELLEYGKKILEKDGIFSKCYMDYYIILRYDNFKEIYLYYGQDKSIRDDHIYKLKSFGESDEYTERLNEYQKLKEEYEQL